MMCLRGPLLRGDDTDIRLVEELAPSLPSPSSLRGP
jgi:hypothetical protein